MRANKWCKGLTAFLAACMLAGMHSSSAAASDYKLGYNTNASENDYVFTTKITQRDHRKIHVHSLPYQGHG
ncbi:MAG: hypothetical protein ACLR0U_01310 [Enterocloster clostridioformis]